MPKKLSDEAIAKRIVRLANLERLYAGDQRTKSILRTEIKQLRAENTELKQQLVRVTETLSARIEELETIVFGRKPPGGLKQQPKTKVAPKRRSAASYRRPIPPASAITDEQHHTIDQCHRCGKELTDKGEAIRYEEDIILAALDPENPDKHKTVMRHTIETGWCSKCGQYSGAKDLRGQVVTIGPVVRSLITYLVVRTDQTYSQVIDLLWQLYRFSITSSEIANILAGRREQYLPMYEQLKTSVRSSPAHLDETSWPIQSEQGSGYAHVMTGTDGSSAEHDVVFVLADSRGKGNSKQLVGENYQQVGVTDRYASYKDLFTGGHQICWAHLHRNARDITRLKCLSKQKCFVLIRILNNSKTPGHFPGVLG